MSKVKEGIAGFGTTVGNQLKGAGNFAGHHLSQAGTKLTDLGHDVKDKMVGAKTYGIDDELVEIYDHDIRRSLGGLKFVLKQNRAIAEKHFPRLLKQNRRIGALFIHLIGPNSLYFKNIDEYYELFDENNALEVVPAVHPKDKQYLIDSINEALTGYLRSVEQLEYRVSTFSKLHTSSLEIRIKAMSRSLKGLLKLIKARRKSQREAYSLQGKMDKLRRRTTPLEEKEEAELQKLEEKHRTASKTFAKVDERLKNVLPHATSFLDEFVDGITKIQLYTQLDIYKDFQLTTEFFSRYVGFLNKDTSIPDYEEIMTVWEADNTAARVRIESFIAHIQEKDLEFVDKEIKDKDETSAATKVMNKMGTTFTLKTHHLKLKDPVNGFFNDQYESDPLEAFFQHENTSMNRNETYYPSKVLSIGDIYPAGSHVRKGPPLPPRSSTASVNLPPRELVFERGPRSNKNSSIYNSLPSVDSFSDDDMSTVDDDASSDISSISSLDNYAFSKGSTDSVDSIELTRAYNKPKNDILISPLTEEIKNLKVDAGVPESSTSSYKIAKLENFYERVIKSKGLENASPIREWEALYDFKGKEEGDLSFKKGDKIEVLLSFQDIDALYQSDGANWFIGRSKSAGCPRVGLAPANYFAQDS